MLGAGIIVIIILVTTSYQTLKAATRNPVEALRYE
jgi:putative ABC transport system permease protein